MIAFGAALACAVVAPRCVAAGGDPWYDDVDGSHWAYQYVRVLWEEQVTDGKIVLVRRDGRQRRESRFYPSEDCTRGQYAMMLAKAFRLEPAGGPPVFTDVREDYSVFDKPAFGHIQAAAAAGIIVGYPDGRYCPGLTITREQAFAMLVRALGLESYAREMGEDEVRRALRAFKDRGSISASLTGLIAVAARFGIVEGYPDGTLRPARAVSRAEAATVVYRSCMVTVFADPSRFSPDEDGANDTTRFVISTLRNRNASAWDMYITDGSGRILRRFNRTHERGGPPAVLAWDGRSDDGRLLVDGTYYYRARVEDRNDNVFWSVLKPVTLLTRALWGSVSPPVAQPGDQVSITAFARGEPVSVDCSTPWNRSHGLALDGHLWRGSFNVPEDAPDGEYQVSLSATYDDTVRRSTAVLTVFQHIALNGSLEPNPCHAGADVTVTALASPCVVAASAASPDLGPGAIDLARAPGVENVWMGRLRVPADCLPGRYAVRLTGRSLTKIAEETMHLTVDEPPLDSIGFILAD